jgi:glycosyltransferase-like protein
VSAAKARRPSVALFTYSTVPRGSVVHTAHLSDALVDAGWDVTVYALDKDRRGFFRPLRARLRLIPAAPAPASTAELVRLRAGELAGYLAQHAPPHDIHHAEDCLSASGLLAARAQGRSVRLARTVHHVERFEDPYLAECQERSIREAELCFTVSADAQREVLDGFAVDSVVVGNGVDVPRFQRIGRAALEVLRARLQPRGPVVLAVGGVEPRKNTLRILQAFARLRQTHARAQLWILGGATVLDHGAYRAAFEVERAALDPATRAAVIELGVVAEPEVPALYRLAHVLALPSLHEGFGLAALEALAAGLPLVASRQPPFTEFLDPSCATLVDPSSIDAIAAGLQRALQAPAAQREAGLRRARAHSWRRVAALHVDHYERTLEHARDALPRTLARRRPDALLLPVAGGARLSGGRPRLSVD